MQEAKARLPEVVKQAESERPQDITHHGRSVAVVVSGTASAGLCGQRDSLLDFVQASPLAGLDDDERVFERDGSPAPAVAP